MTNFQITVRGNEVELRGFIAGYDNMAALAKAIRPHDWLVIGSVAESQDGTAVELFQEKYRQNADDAVTTVENHLARLLALIEAIPNGSRLTIAHKDGEGNQSWVVAVEREGFKEVVRTAETMPEAMHEADAATSEGGRA